MGLATKQVDYTAAFVQAKLSEGEEVFVAMPRGYAKLGKVLKLKKTLYGLKQSPPYMVRTLEASPGIKWIRTE